jgi:hypothetical protein
LKLTGSIGPRPAMVPVMTRWEPSPGPWVPM